MKRELSIDRIKRGLRLAMLAKTGMTLTFLDVVDLMDYLRKLEATSKLPGRNNETDHQPG